MPEDFPAAVCLPVSTPTTLLGTLWVFCNEKRDFNTAQTNILEVVAGRLASDLEREMLLRVGIDGAKLQKQVAAAERRQRNELPTIAPMLDGWDVAGWTAQADNLGGALHDWFCLPDGLLAVAVGRAAEQGIAGALTANAVKTALRSHARYHRQPESVLQQVNLTLWTGSAGDRRATLLLGLIETATGRVCCASAGRPSVMLLRGDGWQSLSRTCIGLGESPEADFQPCRLPVAAGRGPADLHRWHPRRRRRPGPRLRRGRAGRGLAGQTRTVGRRTGRRGPRRPSTPMPPPPTPTTARSWWSNATES